MQNLGGQTECIMGNWKIVNALEGQIFPYLAQLEQGVFFYP